MQRHQAVGELEPLGPIPAVDLVALREIGRVDQSIASLEQHDRAVQEPLDFPVHIRLAIVREIAPRLVEGLLHDDLAMIIGQHLPTPGLENDADAEEVPPLLGLGLGVHVDEVLPECPVDVAPLLRAVIGAGIVPHSVPAAQARPGQRPLLHVATDETTIELWRRHHPMQHRRQVHVRRHARRRIRIGIDV